MVGHHALHDSHATRFRVAKSLTTQMYLSIYPSIHPSIHPSVSIYIYPSPGGGRLEGYGRGGLRLYHSLRVLHAHEGTPHPHPHPNKNPSPHHRAPALIKVTLTLTSHLSPLTLTPVKAASLSGGAAVNFRAHKELAKGTKGSQGTRGQPKAAATVSSPPRAKPTDRRGELAAAARSSSKPRAKLTSSVKASTS